MRKIDQENSRHRACYRRGGLGAIYNNVTGRFRKTPPSFNDRDSDRHLVKTVPVSPGSPVAELLGLKPTAPFFNYDQLKQVKDVLAKGSTYRSIASKIANCFGWSA